MTRLIVLAASLAALSGCGKSAPESPAKSAEEMLQPVILNPDEYRPEITEIDRLVFDEKPFDKERRALLATRLDELAARVKAAKESHFLDIEAYEIKKPADGAKTCRNTGSEPSFLINGCAFATIFSMTEAGSRAVQRILNRRPRLHHEITEAFNAV